LGDDAKRSKYDQLGANWKQFQEGGAGFDFSQWAQQGGGRSYRVSFDNIFEGGSGFSDFFNSFFGGGDSFIHQEFGTQSKRRKSANIKGRDYQANLTISLHEAYHGTSTILNVNDKKIRVPIRPGVKDGQVLRVRDKGEVSYSGGEPGDLLIKINVTKSASTKVKGNDLYSDVKVDLYTAILGGKITIQTISKPVSINIPPETQNGKELRLKGLGMPVFGRKNEFGDLYLKIVVHLPENLNDQEKALFNQLKTIRS
jgi:curved DNA-binding protein